MLAGPIAETCRPSVMLALGYVAVICIGVVLGSIGAGGSMLAVPVLIFLFSMDMETASAYSLFLVGTTSLAGAALKQKQQLVSIGTALVLGIPSVSGAFISRKWLIVVMPEIVLETDIITVTKNDLLLAVFSVMMVTSSLLVLLKKTPHESPGERSPGLNLGILGFFFGMLAGLVGAGGGFLIIPALIFLARLPFQTATGTSLVIIAFNSLLGFCGDLLNRSINWYLLFSLSALSILGVLLGSWYQGKVRNEGPSKKAFAFITIALGVFILIRKLVAEG